MTHAKDRGRHALLLTIAGVVVIGIIVLTKLQRFIIFPSHLAPPLPENVPMPPQLEKTWLESGEGLVEGWLVPGEGVSAERPGPAVVFLHGNAELIDYWPNELSAYSRLGISLLLPEYRGYGRSAGSPSEHGIVEDVVGFYDWLAKRPEVDSSRIILHGRSIGGGVACSVAKLRRPAAMILQSTFTSLQAMARRFLFPGFLLGDRFDNLACVRHFDGPLLVVHGRQDELVPFAHGQMLAEEGGARLVAYDCDHNTCPPDPGRYWQDIANFLRDAAILRTSR